jgi:hypothetical protein
MRMGVIPHSHEKSFYHKRAGNTVLRLPCITLWAEAAVLLRFSRVAFPVAAVLTGCVLTKFGLRTNHKTQVQRPGKLSGPIAYHDFAAAAATRGPPAVFFREASHPEKYFRKSGKSGTERFNAV